MTAAAFAAVEAPIMPSFVLRGAGANSADLAGARTCATSSHRASLSPFDVYERRHVHCVTRRCFCTV